MGRIIAITNQKGGVGKTTTTINLAAVLAALEKKVLIVDIDAQGNATQGIGIDKIDVLENQNSISELLLSKNINYKNYIYQTKFKNLYCIAGSENIVDFEFKYEGVNGKCLALKEKLEPLKEHFDFILIDCPPSLNTITLNGLAAADGIIIPVQAEYYALEGMVQLLKSINICQKHLNPNLKIDGVLLTMFQKNTNLCEEVEKDLMKYFSDNLFETKIHRNINLAEAPSYGEPIIYYKPNSQGSIDYINLGKEVLKNE